MTADHSTERRRQRGIVLVIVLWVLALLGIVAASFQRDTRVETRVTRNLVENAKAEALADAGVQRAMLGLLDPDDTKAWLANGTPYQLSLGEGFPSGEVEHGEAPVQPLRDDHPVREVRSELGRKGDAVLAIKLLDELAEQAAVEAVNV